MSAVLPIWVEWLRALALPVIAGSAATITFFQYRLAKAKRSDELFDRRYQLFSDALWMIEKYDSERCQSKWQEMSNRLTSRAHFLFSQEFSLKLHDIVLAPDDEFYQDVGEEPLRIRYVRENMLHELFTENMK